MAGEGREFINRKVKSALDKIGAEILVSQPATQQQNGVAERNNRTIVNLARTMLIAAGLESK